MTEHVFTARRTAVGEAVRGPLIALELLTVLRLRRPPFVADAVFGRSQAWFPAVGLALGGVLAGLSYLLDGVFGAGVLGWLLVAALALLSGGLHIDGLADTVDGVCGGHTREERLRIMHDGAVGALGAAAVCLCLGLKASAIASLGPGRYEALILVPALGRWASVLVIAAFPYARPTGLGRAFHDASWPWALPVSTLTMLIAAVALLGPEGLLLAASVAGCGLGFGAWVSPKLGGVTGDVYGATVEICEVVALLTFLALVSAGWVA